MPRLVDSSDSECSNYVPTDSEEAIDGPPTVVPVVPQAKTRSRKKTARARRMQRKFQANRTATEWPHNPSVHIAPRYQPIDAVLGPDNDRSPFDGGVYSISPPVPCDICKKYYPPLQPSDPGHQ